MNPERHKNGGGGHFSGLGGHFSGIKGTFQRRKSGHFSGKQRWTFQRITLITCKKLENLRKDL